MIYTAFGLPVIKIISGNIKENKVKILAYFGQSSRHSEIEEIETTVHELRADNGINEIHNAINNPESYSLDINEARTSFQE